MNENKQIDDFVNMLDNFMDNGGGHMNVAVSDKNIVSPTIQTMKSSDCSGPNMACKVPTLHVGIDDEDI